MDHSLEQFVQEMTGDSYLRVQDDLGDGFVRLMAKEAQRRQAKQDIKCVEDVVIELLRNSRDAHASLIFLASWKEADQRNLTIIDNGDGIPLNLHEIVFEPFVTSKLDTFHADRWGVHGRGMALYSIRENTDRALVKYSEKDFGTSIHVDVVKTHLPERTDQSTFPYLVVDAIGNTVLRGPRNIIRTAMEFSIDSHAGCSVFLGSPTEIATTLYHLREHAVGFSFHQQKDSLVYELSYLHDPDQFSEFANKIGLPLSTRSARRIIDGEIKPLQPLSAYLKQKSSEVKNSPENPVEHIRSTGSKEKQKKVPSQSSRMSLQDQRGLKITPEDIETFKNEITEAFDKLAQSYYLEQLDDLKVTIRNDRLDISIPYAKQR